MELLKKMSTLKLSSDHFLHQATCPARKIAARIQLEWLS